MEFPTSLEELIPYDVRQRWGISTVTSLSLPTQNHDKMIAPINTIVIPEDYSEMKEFIRINKISVVKVTKESTSNCIKAIKTWANSHGLRTVMEHTITHITVE
jgi:hypothetical protein